MELTSWGKSMFRNAFRVVSVLILTGLAAAQINSIDAPRLFETGMNALTGVGPSRNNQTALDTLRRSADLGYPPAQVVLGYIYETGSAAVTPDAGQALDWYKKAAKQDDNVGEWLLGRAYLTGVGTPRDLEQAAAALKRSASHNDPFGQYLLGMVQSEKNQYTPAADSFRKAAMQGLPQAQQQLGMLLKDGRGVAVDKSEAYVWLLLSARAGNSAVSADLGALEGDLGSSKTEEAKSRARDLELSVGRLVVARGCTGWPGEFDPMPTPPPPDIQNFCR
jgi:TPR repeat protein